MNEGFPGQLAFLPDRLPFSPGGNTQHIIWKFRDNKREETYESRKNRTKLRTLFIPNFDFCLPAKFQKRERCTRDRAENVKAYTTNNKIGTFLA